MSLQALAHNMAAQGRGPDTMLVHMAPSEVKGLQALAMAHGGSLTINPKTGLPEAGFLSSILPMLAGAFLGPAGAGIFGSALTAGLGVGAATGLATGSLRKGLMAGLGAYGGSGLMSSVMGAGAQGAGAVQAAQSAPAFDYAGIAGTPPIQNIPVAGAAAPITPDAEFLQSVAGAQASSPMSAEVQNLLSRYPAPATSITPPPQVASAPVTATQLPDYLAPGIDTPSMAQSAAPQMGKFDQFKAGLGAIGNKPELLFNKENMKYGLAAAAPLLMAEPKRQTPVKDSEQARYTYSPGRTEEPLGGPYMGERTYFRPSYTRLAAEGGSMSSQYDYVYNPETQLYERKKQDVAAAPKTGIPAGIGAGAEGPSPVDPMIPGDPSHPLYGLMAPIGQALTNAANSNSLSFGLIPALFGQNPAGVPVSDATPVSAFSDPMGFGSYGENVAPGEVAPGVAGDSVVAGPGGEAVDSGVAAGPGGEAVSIARGGLTALARGGYSHLGDYSDGGRLLRGPGDGVSDSIPATIANKRPARLANNEFVIPARIVSEIGNGSTDAGARRLYAMMDRVQKRRAKTVGKGKVAVDSGAHKEVDAL